MIYKGLLLNLHEESKIACITVTHDIEAAVVMGRNILTLRQGSNRTPHILKNNYAAMIDHRNQTAFQNKCDELRKHLETVA